MNLRIHRGELSYFSKKLFPEEIPLKKVQLKLRELDIFALIYRIK